MSERGQTCKFKKSLSLPTISSQIEDSELDCNVCLPVLSLLNWLSFLSCFLLIYKMTCHNWPLQTLPFHRTVGSVACGNIVVFYIISNLSSLTSYGKKIRLNKCWAVLCRKAVIAHCWGTTWRHFMFHIVGKQPRLVFCWFCTTRGTGVDAFVFRGIPCHFTQVSKPQNKGVVTTSLRSFVPLNFLSRSTKKWNSCVGENNDQSCESNDSSKMKSVKVWTTLQFYEKF